MPRIGIYVSDSVLKELDSVRDSLNLSHVFLDGFRRWQKKPVLVVDEAEISRLKTKIKRAIKVLSD